MTDYGPIYPDIEVQLVGTDRNAMNIICEVIRALRHNGVPADRVSAFSKEAMSGDYDNVLATAIEVGRRLLTST